MSKIMITGGTGSFGNAVCERCLKRPDISEIVIFSRDEKKQHDMRQHYNSEKIQFIIGDTRDKDSIMKATRGVDYIFHAAALKQVPTGEFFPMEIVRTNINGTQNVFDAAETNNISRVVLLSTDKAVYPINAMGLSKSLAEKCMIAMARSHSATTFCGIRYGNVMASRGSVIPLFVDKIKAGLPLPITVPQMTRFLLTLDDAVDLVEYALANGEQGDLFVKKSPACTIENLAKALLDIFDSQVAINIIGTRESEKMHETLANAYELSSAEDKVAYWRIRNLTKRNYDVFFNTGRDHAIMEDYTSENTTQLDQNEVKNLLLTLPFIQQSLAIV